MYEGIQPADIKTRHVSSIVDEFVVIKSFIFYIYDPPINHLPTLVGRIVDPIVPIVLQNSSGQYWILVQKLWMLHTTLMKSSMFKNRRQWFWQNWWQGSAFQQCWKKSKISRVNFSVIIRFMVPAYCCNHTNQKVFTCFKSKIKHLLFYDLVMLFYGL